MQSEVLHPVVGSVTASDGAWPAGDAPPASCGGSSASDAGFLAPDGVADPASAEHRWRTRFVLALIVAWGLRLGMALVTDLTPDEAYYWALACRPQASYYDHPPLVAYLIAGCRAMLGDVPLAVRLPALLAYPLVAWAVFRLGADGLRRPAAGFWAACMLHLSPAGLALGFITTPDVPLAAGWAVAALALTAIAGRLERGEAPAGRAWLALGLALGLGAMGKYNMIFFCPAVAALVLGFHRHWPLLRQPGLWTAVGLAALGAAPVLIWNAENDWISFRFQFAHGLTAKPRGLAHNFGEFLGGQLLTLGPVIFPLLVARVFAETRAAWRRRCETRFVLGMMAAPTVAFFIWSGLRSKVEANWPQVAYLSALPLVADWLLTRARPRRWLAAAIGPNLLLTLMALVHGATLVLPLPPNSDVLRRLHGWPRLGELVRQHDALTGGRAVFVAQGAPLAALCGFYGGIPVDRLAEINGRGQFGLWWRGRSFPPGADAVIVDLDRFPEREAKAPFFERWGPVTTVRVERHGRVVHTINAAPFFCCIGSFSLAMPPRSVAE